MSQVALTAARQTNVFGRNESAGQAAPPPAQTSCKSQPPADARQTVPAAESTSAGHVVLLPVQLSAGSHVLLPARQTVVLGWYVSAGQLAPAPGQVSWRSQTPLAARQTVPALRFTRVHAAVAVLGFEQVSVVQGLLSLQTGSLVLVQAAHAPEPLQTAGAPQLTPAIVFDHVLAHIASYTQVRHPLFVPPAQLNVGGFIVCSQFTPVCGFWQTKIGVQLLPGPGLCCVLI